MPPPAPVTTATLPSIMPGMNALRWDESTGGY
jgi:hypothetical protein